MANRTLSQIAALTPTVSTDQIVGVIGSATDALYPINNIAVGVNILWFGAVGDGVTDNTSAFQSFQNFALKQTTPVILIIPPGNYHVVHSDAAGFFQGISDLTIIAYGAVIDHFSSDFPVIVNSIRGTWSWRIQSTAVGDNSFTMLLANNAMAFAAASLQCTNVQNYLGPGAAFAQSVNSNSTGKFYFEATINALTGQGAQTLSVGISNGFGPSPGAQSSLPGGRSFAVFDDGTIWQRFDDTQVGSLGASFSAADVVGCAVDIDAQLGWFRKNGGSWNGNAGANPATGAGGLALSQFVLGSHGWQLLPAFVCTFIAANPGAVTHNFGGSAYAFTAPVGFGNWGGVLNTNYPVNIQAGDWVLITSCDAQDVGSTPPNWQFMEYHKVGTVNTSTGVCTISTPHMRYAHSATQPDISITRNQFLDHGGPATVFLLSPTSFPDIGGGDIGASMNGPNRGQPWAVTTRVYGATLENLGNQLVLSGQDFEFTDCIFNDQVDATVNQRAVYTRCQFNNGTEIDKNISQIEFIDCDWGGNMNMLTSSIEMATFDGCSFHTANTSAKQCIYRDCIVDTLIIGSTYSQNQTLNIENCIIPNYSDLSQPTLALSDTSFSNGIFTLNLDVISHGNMSQYWRFTIPGQAAFIAQGQQNLGSPFTITGAAMVLNGGILTATIAGGSGYTNGTYNYVPLTGGLGAEALANIIVSGNAVTSVTLINSGVHYSVSDVLTAAAANIGGTGSGFTYTVNSVSANNIVQIFTTLAVLPTYAGTGPPVADGVGLLNAPNLTFNSNLGDSEIQAMSLGGDALPAFSYAFMEISGNQFANAGALIPTQRLTGYAVKMRVNVRKPYTGAQGSMALRIFGSSQVFALLQSGSTWTNNKINPEFDLKVAGERIITANRVSGLQPNDADHANGGAPLPFGQLWFKNSSFQPFITASMAADAIGTWPVIDVEIITDQSVSTYSNIGTVDYLQESGWHYIAGTYTAQIGEKILADTTGGAFTITLPPSPALGDFLKFNDAGNIFGTNNLTLGRNGNNINGAGANYVSSTTGAALEAVFVSASVGWRVFT